MVDYCFYIIGQETLWKLLLYCGKVQYNGHLQWASLFQSLKIYLFHLSVSTWFPSAKPNKLYKHITNEVEIIKTLKLNDLNKKKWIA